MALNVSQCRLEPDGTASTILNTAADLACPTPARPLRRLIEASRNALYQGQCHTEVREATNREPHVFRRARDSRRTDTLRRFVNAAEMVTRLCLARTRLVAASSILLGSPGMLSKQ
ncbi:MAG: hypothetical protein AB7F94_01880 [Nitrospira sp.]